MICDTGTYIVDTAALVLTVGERAGVVEAACSRLLEVPAQRCLVLDVGHLVLVILAALLVVASFFTSLILILLQLLIAMVVRSFLLVSCGGIGAATLPWMGVAVVRGEMVLVGALAGAHGVVCGCRVPIVAAMVVVMISGRLPTVTPLAYKTTTVVFTGASAGCPAFIITSSSMMLIDTVSLIARASSTIATAILAAMPAFLLPRAIRVDYLLCVLL